MGEILKKFKILTLFFVLFGVQEKAYPQDGIIKAPSQPIPMGPAIQSTNPVTRAAEAQALQAAALKKQQEIQAAQAAQAAAAAQAAQQNAQMQNLLVPQIQVGNPSQQQNNALPAMIYTLDMVNKINTGNNAVRKMDKLNEPCADCDVSASYTRDTNKKGELSEGKLMAPLKDENNSTHRSTARCGTKDSYEVCTYAGEVTPTSFQFMSPYGDPKNNLGRFWSFNYENNARQDIGFSVQDEFDGHYGDNPKSYMMVFPRKYLPTIRTEGGKQIVTLATGEEVIFDAKTKEIIGGVLSEEARNKKSMPKVKYKGSGVLVRADAYEPDPRQVHNGNTTITKDGKSCKVPTRELWPDQSERSALHFKYAKDEDFDAFLQKKCGFGID